MEELRLRRDGVAWKDSASGILALDERGAAFLAANPSGALLWRALAGGATREELAAELAAEFALDRARAIADTEAFLAQLREHDLLIAER